MKLVKNPMSLSRLRWSFRHQINKKSTPQLNKYLSQFSSKKRMSLWRQKSWRKQKLLRNKLRSFKCHNLSPYIQMELFKSRKQNLKKHQKTSSKKKMMMMNSVISKKPSRQAQRSQLQK